MNSPTPKLERKETVEVTVSWLEGLLEYAKRAEDTKPDTVKKYSPFVHHHFAALIGYIDGAKYLIKKNI